MIVQPWTVPTEWRGETAVLLGGGPSLGAIDPALLRGRARIVAINDAGLVLAPWADVLLYADDRWLAWNRADLGRFRGGRLVKRCRPLVSFAAPDVHVIERAPHRVDLSDDPRWVAGFCSGGAAINLAYLFGARRIVLLGFDMRPGHWHDRHRTASDPANYDRRYAAAIARMAPRLAAAGVDVVNATPGSALRCFPILRPEDAL